MKKWLYIIPLFIIIILWQVIQIYVESMEYMKAKENEAKSIAFQNVKELTTIKDIEYYHGRMAYIVLYGVTEQQEDIIIWVPDTREDPLLVKKASEGWSKEKVKQYILNTQNPLQLIDIRLGAEVIKDNRTNETETTPLWEVTYIDQQNRYTYYFMKFVDGSFVKRYSLMKQRFEEENEE